MSLLRESTVLDRPTVVVADVHTKVLPGDGERLARRRDVLMIMMLVGVLIITIICCLALGRYIVSFGTVSQILLDRVPGLSMMIPETWSVTQERVVTLVRGPRVTEAVLIGACLAVCGTAMQAAFRNPLVNPQILGVSSGASFGGVVAIALGLSSALLVSLALAGGMIVLLLVWAISRTNGGAALTVVLTGVIVSAFFSALVSVVTYLADPYETLPSIVFWLMGSLASATWASVPVVAITTLLGMAVIVPLRWRLNLLTLGDEEAEGLGVRVVLLRWIVLVATAVMVAGAVSVSGVIGWIGLVIPHAARLLVGADHRILVPASALMGATYLLVIDTVARTATAGEIPLGALTALIGAPVFFILLRSNQARMWSYD